MRLGIALTVCVFALFRRQRPGGDDASRQRREWLEHGQLRELAVQDDRLCDHAGRSLTPPVTVDVSAGTYAENVEVGSADSGLTIDGAGDGTSSATDTIIAPPSGLGIATDVDGNASSLTLEHLSISRQAKRSTGGLRCRHTRSR